MNEHTTGSEWRGRTAIAMTVIGVVIAVSLGIVAVASAYTGNTPSSEAVAALSTLGGMVIGGVGTYLGMQAKMPGSSQPVDPPVEENTPYLAPVTSGSDVDERSPNHNQGGSL